MMQNKKLNILVAGWIGSENVGDEAIFSSVLDNLRKLGANITAFSVNEQKTRRLHGVRTAPFEIFYGPRRFIDAIRQCDIMIVGGGGILQDETSVFNTFRYLYKALLALLFKKRVMFYAVGVGPLKFSITKTAIKYVLNRSHGITVRDEKSKRLLVDTGVKKELIQNTFDPVISLNPSSENIGATILKKEIGNTNQKPLVGICLRHWFDIHPLIPVSLAQRIRFRQEEGDKKYKMFVKNVADAIDSINRDGRFSVIFIPFWYSRDSKVHDDVIRLLKNKDDIYSLKREYTPQELLGIFGQLEIVLAMRLHACIYAANQNIPFVPLSYTSKVSNFLAELGLEKYQVDLSTIQSKEISDKFSSVLKNKAVIKTKMKEGVRQAKIMEEENFINLTRLIDIK